MAIDTAQKRRSMISFGDLSFGERVPLATNFATAGGRAAQEYLYFGLTPSGSGASSRLHLKVFHWFTRKINR